MSTEAKPKRTETAHLVLAMDVLSRDLQSEDGAANAAIAEAAWRLLELDRDLAEATQKNRAMREALESLAYWSRSMTETRETLRDRIRAAILAIDKK